MHDVVSSRQQFRQQLDVFRSRRIEGRIGIAKPLATKTFELIDQYAVFAGDNGAPAGAHQRVRDINCNT